jgi:hypothetical protein
VEGLEDRGDLLLVEGLLLEQLTHELVEHVAVVTRTSNASWCAVLDELRDLFVDGPGDVCSE